MTAVIYLVILLLNRQYSINDKLTDANIEQC